MTVILEVHKGKQGVQLSIGFENEDGVGHGYRIAGPKFLGHEELIARHTINDRDAEEIRRYLNLMKPPK